MKNIAPNSYTELFDDLTTKMSDLICELEKTLPPTLHGLTYNLHPDGMYITREGEIVNGKWNRLPPSCKDLVWTNNA